MRVVWCLEYGVGGSFADISSWTGAGREDLVSLPFYFYVAALSCFATWEGLSKGGIVFYIYCHASVDEDSES